MPQVHAELAADGVHIGRKRVARLMQVTSVQGVSRRKHHHTTCRDPAAARHPIWSAATSPPLGRIGSGWPISPAFPRGPASSIWPSSSRLRRRPRSDKLPHRWRTFLPGVNRGPGVDSQQHPQMRGSCSRHIVPWERACEPTLAVEIVGPQPPKSTGLIFEMDGRCLI